MTIPSLGLNPWFWGLYPKETIQEIKRSICAKTFQQPHLLSPELATAHLPQTVEKLGRRGGPMPGMLLCPLNERRRYGSG